MAFMHTDLVTGVAQCHHVPASIVTTMTTKLDVMPF